MSNYTPPWFMQPIVWFGFVIGLLAQLFACLIILLAAIMESAMHGADRACGKKS